MAPRLAAAWHNLKTYNPLRLVPSLRASPANPDQWLLERLGGQTSDAGVVVNERTGLSNVALMSAVRLISSSVGMLPLDLYERTGERSRREAIENPLYFILQQTQGISFVRQFRDAHELRR